MITYPAWFKEWRPHQVDAVVDIVEQFDISDIVILDAPTGAGKTLVAESVRQLLSVRGIYLCSSLSLQDQFVKDFPHAVLLRGRSNYPTADHPERFDRGSSSLSAADCVKQKLQLPGCGTCREDSVESVLHCLWCHPVRVCPYERAKAAAIRAELVCSNLYYFLYEANFQGALSNRSLVIVDECDKLEDILMSFIQLSISNSMVKSLDIAPPTKKTKESAWVDWTHLTIKKVAATLVTARRQASTSTDVRRHRRVGALERLSSSLGRLADPSKGIAAGGWVYTGYDRGEIIFKPIEVAGYAEEYLWRHGQKWLLMSATVISSNVLMSSLGIGT
jgi:Rad3-related DNA helicase